MQYTPEFQKHGVSTVAERPAVAIKMTASKPVIQCDKLASEVRELLQNFALFLLLSES